VRPIKNVGALHDAVFHGWLCFLNGTQV